MEQITDPTTELSLPIAAPAAAVWAVISDVTRTPEWSPVCYRSDRIDSHGGAAVGARFRGYNRLNGARWSRECVVTAVEPERLLAFSTLFKGRESTRWRYRLESDGSTTTLREAYQIVMIPPWLRVLRRVPGVEAKGERDTHKNITSSLERIKAIVEREALNRSGR